MTSRELLAYFHIGRSTLWRLRRDGLPALRVRGSLRFDLEAVRAWLAADPHAILPAGRYRCRGCGYVGDVEAPRARASMVCPGCAARANVEPVGSR